MKKETSKKFSVLEIANSDGCFDLQFRKDTRHKRHGSPTYYRWKIQFIITLPTGNKNILEKIKKEIGCGAITASKNQVRLSVQKIDDVADCVIPYFKKNTLSGNKKKDFDLWQKAVEIIYNNKGKQMLAWKKSDLNSLIQIHKSISQYKNKPRESKWADMAKTFAKGN